jgi:hypothetical protein
MVSILDGNVAGKGVRFARIASVFIARGGAAVAGGTYVLTEDITTPDDADATVANSGADNGSLANTFPCATANIAGLGSGVAGGQLAVFVLATEAAVDNAPYIGLVEGYYVDALVTTSAARVIRTPLYPLNASAVQQDAPTVIGRCATSRVLANISGAIASVLTKVHFCGTPGGFGVGPGTT